MSTTTNGKATSNGRLSTIQDAMKTRPAGRKRVKEKETANETSRDDIAFCEEIRGGLLFRSVEYMDDNWQHYIGIGTAYSVSPDLAKLAHDAYSAMRDLLDEVGRITR
jgi:hypothetical protein